jgi:hypothetical protein
MKYSEYEKAAKRHRETCNILLELHKDGFIGSATLLPEQKTKMLHNVYYLSGYIIECIFSYKFFDLMGYDKNRSIRDLNQDQDGFKFHNVFATHRMDTVINYIGENGGTKVDAIPIVGRKGIEDIEQKMFDEWKTEVRYTIKNLTFPLTFKNVKAFYDLSDSIYKQTRKL